ncbi:hypothetical protein bpSLO_001436 (plasmid) [Borrelia parkeri]|nr:hypothetical protein bpSLO_001436 [Borrelia parkeri]
MYFTNNDINAKNIPILRVIRVPNIQPCSLDELLNSDAVLSSLLSSSILLISISFLTREISLLTDAISDFNSFLTISILLSKSLMSDFNSFLTISIFTFKLLSTESILLSSSLNLMSILLSSSVLTEIISDFKLRSNISNLRLKLLSKYSISL